MPTLNELKTFIYVLNKEEIKIVRKNLQDEETILLNLVLGKNLKKIEQQVSTWGGPKTKKIINSFYTK